MIICFIQRGIFQFYRSQVMKQCRLFLISLLVTLSFSLMAQTNNEPQVKKEAGKVRVTIVQGQDHLVLVTGRKASGYNPNIEIALDSKAWETFDSVLHGKQSSSAIIKDVDGHKVDVALANVNGNTGLMFTSGSKCVAITKEDFEKLRN